jgi:uncharacterized membrane protein HdeD (DUF308 family)
VIGFDRILRWFGIIIVLLMLIFGVVVLFTKYFTYIPVNMRIVMGFFIISYGAYRLVSIFNKYRKDEED